MPDPNDSTEEVLSDEEGRRESARWWPKKSIDPVIKKHSTPLTKDNLRQMVLLNYKRLGDINNDLNYVIE